MEKKVPFSVDRNDLRPLFNQVVDGMREAIVSGYWAPGDKIPTSRELCPALGVSRIVTKAALERLAAEGLVVSRPRIGTVVRDRAAKQWRGHVVLVYAEEDNDNYLRAMLAGAMRDGLTAGGWLFSMASVARKAGGGCDFTHLGVVLARSVDLVVVMYHRPEIDAYLAKRAVPFAVFGEKRAKPAAAVGAVHFDYDMATGDFAAACRAAGVREVVEVYWHRLMCDVAPALKRAGIRARKVKVKVDESEGRLIGAKRAGRVAFEKMLRGGGARAVAGRCFFLADDYLAEGALLALAGAGLRAPEDVSLATWANKGLGPDYIRPLSRMEMDPFAAGRIVADAIVAFLKTGEFPANVTVGPQWIAGETIRKQTGPKEAK